MVCDWRIGRPFCLSLSLIGGGQRTSALGLRVGVVRVVVVAGGADHHAAVLALERGLGAAPPARHQPVVLAHAVDEHREPDQVLPVERLPAHAQGHHPDHERSTSRENVIVEYKSLTELTRSFRRSRFSLCYLTHNGSR